MNEQKNTEKTNGKKKGLWSLIKESMTKTGGCCCGGGDCCGSSPQEAGKQKPGQKPAGRNS